MAHDEESNLTSAGRPCQVTTVAAALSACLPGSGAAPASFDVLLRVAADGTIGAALVRPKRRGPDCVAGRLKRRTFPKPPVDGTWKAVRVRLNP